MNSTYLYIHNHKLSDSVYEDPVFMLMKSLKINVLDGDSERTDSLSLIKEIDQSITVKDLPIIYCKDTGTIIRIPLFKTQ